MTPPEDLSIPEPATADDPLIGVVLGSRYRIDKRLGRGTTGAVYRAMHVKFGRGFAVKVLNAERTGDDKLVRRFEREAELGGKVRHPNVISVVDVGEAPDGTRYMVMDLAIGVDLGTVLEDDAPLASSRVIHLLRGLCEGLAHAHERGVIHRDFKPENIIIELDDDGREVPRIVDFGIAIARDETDDPHSKDRLTTGGLVLGTPHYMAPEQATASPFDHRIDLFALGVIAFEMLCGVLPYDGTGADVARANLLQPTPAMSVRAPGVVVDALLEAFTQRLMAKEAEARPPTATAARELLDLIEHDRAAAAALLGLPIEAAEAPPAPRGPKRLETVPDPVLLARRAARPPPSWLTPTSTAHLKARAESPAPEQVEIVLPPPQQQRPQLPVEAPPVAIAPAPRERDQPRPYATSASIEADRGGGRARVVIAIVVAAVVVGGGVYIATRSPAHVAIAVRDAGAPVAQLAVDAAAAVVVVAPPVVDAAIPDAAAAIAVAPARADAGAVARVPRDAAAAVVTAPDARAAAVIVPPPDAAPVAAAAPSAAEVARAYTEVGEALKALSMKIGPNLSEQYQLRFRLIRLTAALATAESRREASATLAALLRDIETAH